MDMHIVAVYKKGKNIQGFRLLATNPDGSTEIRDEEYSKVKVVASMGLIKNLKVENGELKGVGGSIDRYAVRGKGQAVVILNELHDNSGKTIGYYCSDADGKTRNLTPEQVIMFADKFAIANGKIVADQYGKRRVSSIEGTYDIITKNTANNQIPVKQNTQQQQKKSNLPADVQELIKSLKASPKFSGSHVEKIVATVESTDRCSFNQKNAMNRALQSFNGVVETNNKIGVTDEVKKLIDDCRKCKGYKGSFAAKLVASILRNNDCSEKQFRLLKEQYEKLSENNKQSTQINDKPVENKDTAELIENSTQQNNNTEQANSTEITKEETVNTPKKEVNTDNSSNIISDSNINTGEEKNEDIKNEPTAEEKEAATRKIEKLKREQNREQSERDRLAKSELINLQRKQMNAKQKRAVDQTILSDNIYDYSLRKDGTAYIEGFKSGVDVPANVVIPEYTVINNKKYKIIGITMGAFAGEAIESLQTSKFISDIGQGALENCSVLQILDLSLSQHTLIPRNLCKNCSKLNTVKVGNFIQRVHEYAFAYCRSIEEMILPSTAVDIAAHAFDYCINLKSVHSKVKRVDSYAFYDCRRLVDFDFSEVNRIATYAFRNTGFKDLVLPGNITSLGRKAFTDCIYLSTVTIEDGMEEIGEYCFAKHELEADLDTGECILHDIKTPKSLKTIEYGAFRHVAQVTGYTGSVAESHCIANDVPFLALDRLNSENATKVRIKSKLIGNNPIESLKFAVSNEKEGASNPDYKLNTSKLISAPLNDSTLETLGITKSTVNIEPHIKFKAALNYLQDVSSLFKTPLTGGVLRLQNVFYINTKTIYDDGCNKIYKIGYEMNDTLEQGEFIIAIQNNSLVYITDCNLYTNIEMSTDNSCNDNLPVKSYLHVGDVIGKVSTISGHSGVIIPEGVYGINRNSDEFNIGYQFYSKILRNAIAIKITNKDRYVYIPCEDIALNLHDKTADKIDEQQKIDGECEAILKMLSYDDFIKDIKSVKKNVGGSEKFFNNLSKMSDSAVKRYLNTVGNIEDEKEAQLYRVSKAFVDIVHNSGNIPNPNLLTRDIFEELASSYWMICKDADWLRSTGRKSLNQTAVYHIGNCKLTEYKSNQVVKFSNPYMNGMKGAYVYVLTNNNTCLGVYASRYSMHYICEKLYELTDMSNISSDEIPDSIMDNPSQFDKVSPKLFYHFYDILQSAKGWSFSSYTYYSRYNSEFNISMYKPNGIFYITTTRIAMNDDNKARYVTIPILPIGNMDKALIVATTTNSNAKNNKRIQSLLEELMDLAAELYVQDKLLRVNSSELQDRMLGTYNNYIKARELVMTGVKDANQYKKLINDRIRFMMGTVHKGVLQREKSVSYDEDYDVDNIDEIELDIDDVSDIDDTIDVEDDIDIELDDTEEEIDLDDESDEMSFEEFFEMAKGMGVTDESQARAMYVNFMNSQ